VFDGFYRRYAHRLAPPQQLGGGAVGRDPAVSVGLCRRVLGREDGQRRRVRNDRAHAAVVARECRLSAVVGVPNAFEALPDGARIRVDGSTGAVVLLGE
jgi:PEP-utilising enzyme, mobile domain